MTKQGGWQPSGFGGRLRDLRESRGWTQAELSQRAGCNRFTVAKLGWQPRFPDLESIVRTAWAWHRVHPGGYSRA